MKSKLIKILEGYIPNDHFFFIHDKPWNVCKSLRFFIDNTLAMKPALKVIPSSPRFGISISLSTLSMISFH